MWFAKFTLLFLLNSLKLSYENTFGTDQKDILSRKCGQGPPSCPISIAHNNQSEACRLRRNGSVTRSRQYYRLTRYGEKPTIKFPLRDVPFLNQTKQTVEFFAVTNEPFQARWLAFLGAAQAIYGKFKVQARHQFANVEFSKESDYMNLYEAHKKYIASLGIPHMFGNPTLFPSFTDVIYNGRYMSDDVFVQQRLAATCPFLLKLVTKRGNSGFSWCYLKEKLNTEHDFSTDLRNAINEKDITMAQAVEKGRLYALYHEELNDLRVLNGNYNNERPLMNITSPITLFARTLSGELKVVAIQIDDKVTSPVYSPKSKDLEWAVAKAVANLADVEICQGKWHFGYIHIVAGSFCTIFRSHLSDMHPIYQIMQFHCEGTTTAISTQYTTLLNKDSAAGEGYTMGYRGFHMMTSIANKTFNYGKLDFDNILKSNGLDSKELKYYPFRDDGEVIWLQLKSFAVDFTNLYYATDADVQHDFELQSFIKQMSVDCGPGDLYGGKGNIAGLPCFLATKDEVTTFLTRFIWQIVMHDVIMYPLDPFSTFPPLGPVKMYANVHNGANRKNHTLFSFLTDKASALSAYDLVMQLPNIRVNRMFDYHDKIQDSNLSKLVKKYHFHFATCIQELLENRNKDRKKNKQLGFQYLEPKWLTNSVHA